MNFQTLIEPFTRTGSLNQDPNNYFWFHHTDGDRMEVEDPYTLDKITAMWAAMAYVAADIDIKFQDPSTYPQQ